MPHVDGDDKRAAQRERYRRKIEAGECSRCPAPALPDRVRCARHARENPWRQIIYRERRSLGLCGGCGELPVRGLARCRQCLDQERNSYRARRAAGLCGRCGGNPEEGMKTCRRCLDMMETARLKRRERAKRKGVRT